MKYQDNESEHAIIYLLKFTLLISLLFLIFIQDVQAADFGQRDLVVGETWDLGNGYSIVANAIDAKASPRQVWLTLSDRGKAIDEKILIEGETYNYINIFKTTAASIRSGVTSDIVTLTNTYTERPVTKGRILVYSHPSNASISLDGIYQGITTKTITDVSEGSHTITIRFTGYQDWSKVINVVAGETIIVSADLDQVPTKGNISISVNSGRANIYLDGIYQGITPKTIQDVKAGSHLITLKLADYQDWSDTINVIAGQTLNIEQNLIPVTTISPIIYIILGLVIVSVVFIIYRKRKSPEKNPVIGKKYEKSAAPVEIEVVPEGKIVPEAQPITPVKAITEPVLAPRSAYGVVIGIGKYKDPDIPSLRYAVNDALEIYNILTDSQYGNFPKENVKLLLDEQATLTEIKSAMGTYLARKAGKDDTVCIYFAGHGSPEIDPTGKSDDMLEKFIVPYDAKKDDLYSYGLSMDEIRKIYERIESKRVVFFLDSCYSGEAGGRTFSRPDIKGRNITISDKFLEDLSGEGRLIITASKPDELSLETTELEHGIFTYYLAEGLKGKADFNKDGVVTADELYSYVYEQVTTKARNLGASQHPLKKGTIIGEIPLTRYETENMRRVKELHSIAAELVKECKYEEALKKYKEILTIDEGNLQASSCIPKLIKIIEEHSIKKKIDRLSELYFEGKLTPKHYELARNLLKSRCEELSKADKKALKLVNDLLSGQISISTFQEEIEKR